VKVPNLDKLVIQASGAAGTTVRRIPGGICPPNSSMNTLVSVSFGQWPSPATVKTVSDFFS
jgi:hypothetical protein